VQNTVGIAEGQRIAWAALTAVRKRIRYQERKRLTIYDEIADRMSLEEPGVAISNMVKSPFLRY